MAHMGDNAEWYSCGCGKTFESERACKSHRARCTQLPPVHPSAAAEDAADDTRDEQHMEVRREALYRDTVSHVVDSCTAMRCRLHASNTVVLQAKALVKTVIDQIRTAFEANMAALPNPADCLESVLTPILTAVQSVNSAHSEAAARDLPIVAPVPRVLGKRGVEHTLADGRKVVQVEEDIMYDGPFKRTLQNFLEHSPDALQDVLQSNGRWQERWERDGPVIIEDAVDGQGFRRHAGLGAPFQDGDPVRLAFGFYGDGAGIANPVGVFRNNSRCDFFYWFLFNLKPDHRLALINIQLAGLCKNEDLKRYGAALVTSGEHIDPTMESTSFGAGMHAMHKGTTIQIPNPTTLTAAMAALVASGLATYTPYVTLHVVGWCLVVVADCPAAAELLCFKMAVGPSTVSPCRLCNAQQVDPENPSATPMRRPGSFLPWRNDGTCRDEDMTTHLDLDRMGFLQIWKLRTSARLAELEKECAHLQPGARPAFMRRHGVNAFELGVRFPLYDICGAPIDIEHAEMQGNLPRHLLGLLFLMIKVLKLMSLDAYNAAVRNYRKPPGCIFQPIPDSSIVGTANGFASSAHTYIGMRGHDMMIFAIHSTAILGPFVPDDMQSSDWWRCWCLHIEYFTLLLSTSFSLAMIKHLDSLIYQQQALFLSIPQYSDLWMPNNHHAQHFPMDILLWGPSRLLCCLRFEANNQVFIRAGRHTNFRSLLKSMAEKVAVRRALDHKTGAANQHFELRLSERFTEQVTYGQSSAIDLLWDGDLLPQSTVSIGVKVQWLVSLQYTNYEYSQGDWMMAKDGQADCLCRLADIFTIADTVYLLVEVFRGALKHDPNTSQLFAFSHDLDRNTKRPRHVMRFFDFGLRILMDAPLRNVVPMCTMFWYKYM